MSAISAAGIGKCQGVSVARSDGSDVSGAVLCMPMTGPRPLGLHARAPEVLASANWPARSAWRSRLMKAIKSLWKAGRGALRLSW